MPVRTAVLVLNYNGKAFLEACLTSLGAMDVFQVPGIPRDPQAMDEVWLVDNGSTDGSVAFVTQRFPWVRIFRLPENLGFSKAYNQAVRSVDAEWVAFLNNDTRVEADWLRQLHACRLRHPQSRAVAAVMLSWDGERVDFIGGETFFFGQAWQSHLGETYRAEMALEKPLLFGCAGSLLVHRETFLHLGGFDEAYFSFFEDVDLGWRFNLAGHQVWLCPQAKTYHRGHATWGESFFPRKRLLLERNALANVYKNWGEERMGVFFLAASALTFFRSWWAYTEPPVTAPPHLTADSMAHLLALKDLARWLPLLHRSRAQVQALRRCADEEILPLFGKLSAPPLPESFQYRRLYRLLVSRLELHRESVLPSWHGPVNALALEAAEKLLSLWQRVLHEPDLETAITKHQDPQEKWAVPLSTARLGWRIWQTLEKSLDRPIQESSLRQLIGDLEAIGELWERESSPTWVWSPPPVSVIVRTKDRPEFLHRALSSIAMQEVTPEEVVVVNDGGEDPTPILKKLPSLPALRLVHHTRPLGRSAAADRGLREAQFPFVTFLDDDDAFRPNHLRVLLGAVANGARVAYSDVEVVHLAGEEGSEVLGRGRFAYPFDPTRLLFENFIPICAVLLERELALAVGGFDTSLQYFEDWDLWLRLAKKAHFFHCPVVTATYFVRPALGHGTATGGEHRWPHFAAVWEKHKQAVSGESWAEYFRTWVEPTILQARNLEKEVEKLRWELNAIATSRSWKLLQRLRRLLGREPRRPF
ncbi:MAG: glycosyltransferase [Thermoanaerobaculaceae bacterium]